LTEVRRRDYQNGGPFELQTKEVPMLTRVRNRKQFLSASVIAASVTLIAAFGLVLHEPTANACYDSGYPASGCSQCDNNYGSGTEGCDYEGGPGYGYCVAAGAYCYGD
jgi:hypothetical protein